MKTQKNSQSKVWWLGLVLVIAQGVCGLLTTANIINDVMAGSIMASFALVLAYCNGNNPSLKGVYSIKEIGEEGNE